MICSTRLSHALPNLWPYSLDSAPRKAWKHYWSRADIRIYQLWRCREWPHWSNSLPKSGAIHDICLYLWNKKYSEFPLLQYYHILPDYRCFLFAWGFHRTWKFPARELGSLSAGVHIKDGAMLLPKTLQSYPCFFASWMPVSSCPISVVALAHNINSRLRSEFHFWQVELLNASQFLILTKHTPKCISKGCEFY